MTNTTLLERALQWAQTQYPASSIAHQCAFANSVVYLVTGTSGGFGGPSLREHLCSWSLAGKGGCVVSAKVKDRLATAIFPDGSIPPAGEWGFEEACAHCAPLCFNPPERYDNKLVKISQSEHCFDDDEDDLEYLRGKS